MDAPWFVQNKQIYRDLKWETVTDFMVRKDNKLFEIDAK